MEREHYLFDIESESSKIKHILSMNHLSGEEKDFAVFMIICDAEHAKEVIYG